MWYNPAVYCTEGALAMFIRRRTIFGEVITPTMQTRVECLAHEARHFFFTLLSTLSQIRDQHCPNLTQRHGCEFFEYRVQWGYMSEGIKINTREKHYLDKLLASEIAAVQSVAVLLILCNKEHGNKAITG